MLKSCEIAETVRFLGLKTDTRNVSISTHAGHVTSRVTYVSYHVTFRTYFHLVNLNEHVGLGF